MGELPPVLYEFGPFRLDPSERVLLRHGERVTLTPKVFDTLLALVQSGGKLLEKDALMRLVWPDMAFVEEGNLKNNIFVLRKALGETADQRYIETVPKRGYRFIAEVRQVWDAAAGPMAEPQAVRVNRFNARLVAGIVLMRSSRLARPAAGRAAARGHAAVGVQLFDPVRGVESGERKRIARAIASVPLLLAPPADPTSPGRIRCLWAPHG